MPGRTAAFTLLTLILTVGPATGQVAAPRLPSAVFELPSPISTASLGATASPTPIDSWVSSPAPDRHRGRNALIGGLIGGATGIVACTVISNIANDPGTGFSTCDATAYLGFALGGGALGALIGWLI